MKNAIILVITLLLTPQLISASFGWLESPAYSSPLNTDNKCTEEQSKGFDWSDLDDGSFSVYGEISFQGFSSSSSFTFSNKNQPILSSSPGSQKKYITGLASYDESVSPRFGISPSKKISSFSITRIFVSVEFDCDLEFHYDMLDGSVCRHRIPCSIGGSIIENTQCGGATSVTVIYPKQRFLNRNNRKDCHFGFHSIEFDCNPPTSVVDSYPQKTKVVTATETEFKTLPTSSIEKDDITSKTSTYTQVLPISPSPMLSVSIPDFEVSPTIIKPKFEKTTLYTSVVTPSAPVTTAPCPDVLPACLNTWIFSIGCRSNADVACFCPSSGFDSAIYSCIAAHANSEHEMRLAQSYYQGICAGYISMNPGIVTDIIPLEPPPINNKTRIDFGYGSITNIAPVIPITVIEIRTTISVAYTETVVEPSPIYISMTLTVPEVKFTTITSRVGDKYITDVGLIPASPRVTEQISRPTDSISHGTSPLRPLISNISNGNKLGAKIHVLGAVLLIVSCISL